VTYLIERREGRGRLLKIRIVSNYNRIKIHKRAVRDALEVSGAVRHRTLRYCTLDGEDIRCPCLLLGLPLPDGTDVACLLEEKLRKLLKAEACMSRRKAAGSRHVSNQSYASVMERM